MDNHLVTFNALFERSVARRGDALAVKDANQACSYRELSSRAAALAHELRLQGVSSGDAVVIYADRSVHTVAAVLAVLKAGGVFVPVSLDTPPARLDLILSDANARLLLVDGMGRDRLAGRNGHVRMMMIDGVAGIANALPPFEKLEDGPLFVVRPEDLAYIIYTSGTSGEPKGIMIEQGSIARRYDDWETVFGLSDSPVRVLQVAKLGFDVFIADVVKALGSGGILVMCPGEAVLDPARLYALLVDEAIDYVDIVPAVLRHLVEHLEATGQDLACLRTLNCGADLWTKDEYERARRITKVQRLFNSYGVTECTVENTLFEDDGTALDGKSTLPIGRALASDTILILDDALNPVAPGVTGQICIGGPCVARGYVNRPELNQRAFFVRADGHGNGVRFYKTGDLGRADANGVIEFLGRIDFQIKINGHRIELEEIESVLERFPSVRQAVVCFDTTRRALTAFVRTAGGAPLKLSDCSAHMARQLPSFMVPGRIVVVETFPLNQNGKVDRAGLARELALSSEESGKRRAHDLHESRSVADLRERLAVRGVDLISLVNEFVKPSAQFGVLVTGALAGGTGSESSPLELLVLLNDGNAMKRRKREIAGWAVEYHAVPHIGDARASLTMDGLEIALDFVVGGHAAPDFPGTEILPVASAGTDWTVHGHDIVERWQRHPRPSGHEASLLGREAE